MWFWMIKMQESDRILQRSISLKTYFSETMQNGKEFFGM
jgi:hypothetical protein